MAYANGRDGKVEIVGFNAGSSASSLIVLCVKKWDADIQRADHDTSDTCEKDWTKAQVGKKTLSFSIDGQLDLANNPFGATANVLNTDYAAVKLSIGSTVIYNLPNAIVSSSKITSAENDIVSFTITGKSTGFVSVMGSSSSSSG